MLDFSKIEIDKDKLEKILDRYSTRSEHKGEGIMVGGKIYSQEEVMENIKEILNVNEKDD